MRIITPDVIVTDQLAWQGELQPPAAAARQMSA